MRKPGQIAFSGKGVVPTPVARDENEDVLMEYGILKTDGETIAELEANKQAHKRVAVAAQ